jgi:hypothetical protein
MPMSETDPNHLVHYLVENKVATITLSLRNFAPP